MTKPAPHRTVESLLNPGPVQPYRDEWIQDKLHRISNAKMPILKGIYRNIAMDAELEIVMLRKRIQQMAVEISEWRFKVAGSNYEASGQQFTRNMLKGMRERGYSPIYLSDDDFKG